MNESADEAGGESTRSRTLAAAAQLLASGGRDALTTRAVAAAAGVQGPTIYRLFGDKSGLIDAVAEHGFAEYLSEKKFRAPGPDPVENLKLGWDLHIGFGLAHPALYSLMYGDPRGGVKSVAAANSERILRQHIHAIALAGRLRVSEERAAGLVHAAGSGTVLSLLSVPEGERDLGLSDAARDAVIGAITMAAPSGGESNLVSAAITLRAGLAEATVLSDGERALLKEWLDRLVGG